MEHNRYKYSAISRRPKLTLPDGARVAVWITPNVEHYHYDKPAMSITQMTASLKPDVLNYAWRDYGVRVGIWRIMDILERQGFVATAALNSEVCTEFPEIVEAGNALGWEWMAHGPNNSMLFTGMPEEAEKPIITGVLDEIAKGTGKRARGWLGPALTETDHTLDLLSEAGIEYVADWCNDEQPYTMKTRSGSIVAMPYTVEIGDIPAFLFNGQSGQRFRRHDRRPAPDQMYAKRARRRRASYRSRSIRFLASAIRYRARHLERALAHIRKRHDVWIATGSAMLDWYRSSG